MRATTVNLGLCMALVMAIFACETVYVREQSDEDIIEEASENSANDTNAGSDSEPSDSGGADSDGKSTNSESAGLDSEEKSSESVAETIDGWQDSDTDKTVVISDEAIEIVEPDGNTVVCYEAACDGRVLECGDCVDNDGDGKVDARDRECLGPCDNTEGPALISGVGGVTGSTCHVDCYFDYGNGMGSGSDDCWWDHQCDPLEPEKALCPYSEKRTQSRKFCPNEQSDRCTQVCIPFTPNGCDCFGCCTFPELTGLGPNGDDGYVWIGAKDSSNNGSCTFDDVLDEAKCPRCTPIPNCLNDCGKCELCIGKTELPAECFSTPDGEVPDIQQCPDGTTPCGLPEQAPCAEGYFCISGCCKPTTPVV